MKKILFLVLISIFTITYFSYNTTGLLNNIDKEKCSVGVYALGDCDKKIFNRYFSHGFACEIFDITPEIYYSYSQDGKILGEFFQTDLDNFNYNIFAQKFGLIIDKITQISNTKNIYAKTALLPYKISNVSTNLQISIKNNQVIVASPLILGSF